MSIRGALAALALVLLAGPAMADNWTATKLRGAVFTYVGGGWVQLHRGDVVPDGQAVQTQASGRVTLVRGAEMVEVGPTSQIQIVDRDGRQYTTVKQFYGTVEIEAEVRNVVHFAVVNEHLAAVVKGTHFRVTSNEDDAAVSVTRGRVMVQDLLTSGLVSVTAGETVTTSAEAPLVIDSRHTPAITPAATTSSPGSDNSGPGNDNGGSGGGNDSTNTGGDNVGNGGGDDDNGGHDDGGNHTGHGGDGDHSGHGGGGDDSGHGGGGDNNGHGGHGHH